VSADTRYQGRPYFAEPLWVLGESGGWTARIGPAAERLRPAFAGAGIRKGDRLPDTPEHCPAGPRGLSEMVPPHPDKGHRHGRR
jgi:hypothetical protein